MFYPHTIKGKPTFRVHTQLYRGFGFDGVGQYLSVPHDISLDLDTGDKTHAIWFKTNSGGTHALISKGKQANGLYYDIYVEGGTVQARAQTAGAGTERHYKTTSTAFADNSWHLAIVRWNSFGVYGIIIDDVNQALTAVLLNTVTSINTIEPFYIGTNTISSNPVAEFLGSLTQVFMFNRTLSNAEATILYHSGKPLNYPIIPSVITDDASLAFAVSSNDSTLIDLSGNGNDGTAINGATFDGDLIEWALTT